MQEVYSEMATTRPSVENLISLQKVYKQMQSRVDLFLKGEYQQEELYNLMVFQVENFAKVQVQKGLLRKAHSF